MKKKFILIFYLLLQDVSISKNMTLDNLNNKNLINQSQQWIFITDQVMGGLSSGSFEAEEIDGSKCYRMTGNVSTKNNGGFIQIRTKLKPEINTNNYKGIFIKVYGNEKNYSLHLRTPLTLAPWQYYSYSFFSTNRWTEIKAPFIEFKKSNFYQPKSILNQKIKSIGLVAGFEDFNADICLSEIGFY